MKIDVFEKLIYIGKCLGAITSANLYNEGFMTVEGETEDGRKFSVTLCIKEEEKKDDQKG